MLAGMHFHSLWNYPSTSFQQEESMAKLRYERQMLEERMSRTGGDQQGMDTEDTLSDRVQQLLCLSHPSKAGIVDGQTPMLQSLT